MTQNAIIQDFLTNGNADFNETANHDTFDKVMEVIKHIFKISKKEKLQAITVKGEILFLLDGRVLADVKVRQDEKTFSILSMTAKSVNKMESLL